MQKERLNIMIYIKAKLVRAATRYGNLNGKLKLPFHTKRKIMGIEYKHRKQISKFKKSNSEYLKKAEVFLKTNFNGYRDVIWHRCYASQNGIKKVNYIPEDIFYEIIEKSLNNCELADAYTDKNLLQKLFNEVSTPITILRIIHGRYYSAEYNLIGNTKIESLFELQKKYVFKPTIDTYGGKGVVVGQKSKIIDLIHEVMDKSNGQIHQNYIIQEYVEQHDALSILHPQSLNTLRIMTLRLGAKIYNISSLLRMGVNKNIADNVTSGGIVCGINKNGNLKSFAYDISFNKYEIHPTTKIKFDGYQIPSYPIAVEFCKRLHEDLLHFDLISWDIAISSQSEPILIELNLYGQGINIHQFINGPLFGDLTEELLKTLSL